MEKILVAGAGTMGSGIAQVFAQAGYCVLLYDIGQPFVDKGIERIEKTLSRMVGKALLEGEDKAKILGNIAPLYDLCGADGISLAVEAISEDMQAKVRLYGQLDDILKDGALIASNTSALSITELAAQTKRPENFIGMHFFNPANTMKLVEVIKGLQTSDATLYKAKEYVQRIGKTGVEVEESPGFVVNRMLVPMINEAAFLLSEGIASANDIDYAMKLGANHPIGPLALADLIGVDVCLAVMETLYEKFGDTKYRACTLLHKMVAAGYLGRKTKKGFYAY